MERLLQIPYRLGEAGAVVETPEHTLAELVHAAAQHDKDAWDELVVRFHPLVMSVTARYRLREQDAADVSQTLWLRLVQHLSMLREPAALPGWIVTTTRNECLRVIRIRQRTGTFDPLLEPPRSRGPAAEQGQVDEDLMRDERHDALLSAFAELSGRHRELLTLLLTDPPVSYAEISKRLSIPVGAIGPTRARALQKLRRSPALAALLSAESLG
jgi:RNA polymerase sigma factor (sigma-70 family)